MNSDSNIEVQELKKEDQMIEYLFAFAEEHQAFMFWVGVGGSMALISYFEVIQPLIGWIRTLKK